MRDVLLAHAGSAKQAQGVGTYSGAEVAGEFALTVKADGRADGAQRAVWSTLPCKWTCNIHGMDLLVLHDLRQIIDGADRHSLCLQPFNDAAHLQLPRDGFERVMHHFPVFHPFGETAGRCRSL